MPEVSRTREASRVPDASLSAAAVAVLTTADAAAKARLSRATAAAWRRGESADIGTHRPPQEPGRPARPELKSPREMPRRRVGSGARGRGALLHALAHIELNAIDLAWDIVARFTDQELPRAFYDDWVGVADEEARHFTLLSGRLAELDMTYGDLPAHAGLWQAALDTRQDLLVRLAVVPLVFEARGLDVTPGMIAKFEQAGDSVSADILRIIYRDEIGHVAVGKRWFDFVAAARGLDAAKTWRELVRIHYKGRLKAPFNTAGRAAAGMPEDLYSPLAE